MAVLYGEATELEQREFNIHVLNCDSCREEIKDLGAVRNAVDEWRAAEFLRLETPEIVLPQSEKTFVLQTEKTPLFEKLRAILFPVGGFWQGATAFAALAICAILLAVFAFAVFNGNDKNRATIEPPNVEQKLEKAQVSPTPKTTLPVEIKQPNSAPPIPKPNPSAGKPDLRPNHRRVPSNNDKKPPVRNVPAKDVDLDFEHDETEDDSLRLTDLLDEITPGGDK